MMDYWSNFRCRKVVPLFNVIVPATSPDCKFALHKLETSLYRVVQSIFRYVEPLRRAHECDRRMDRQTDFGVTNATLH